MTRHDILTITLNPALDMAATAPSIAPNRKLRCSNPTSEPGGGGINVSRAIAKLGGTATALVALGGPTGETLATLLRGEGHAVIIAPQAAPTRLALAMTDEATGEQYRFGFPGEPRGAADLAAVKRSISEALSHGYAYTVLSGSLPPGMPRELYATLIREAKAAGSTVIFDSSGDALARGIEATPFLIKLDYHEALELLGLDDLSEKEAISAAEELRGNGAADIVIITLREKGAAVASHDGHWRMIPPKHPVVSAIGAGDSFIGGATLALSRGKSIRDACCFGVACAASAVTTPGSQLVDPATAEAYARDTEIRDISV